jgi:glycosyltransferase involved in cell wall biosynthesis
VTDVRWFAPNRYCALPVPALRRAGLEIALTGEEPAGLAFAADGACVAAAFEYSRRRRCPLAVYIWDLPPWRLGSGKPDLVFEAGGHLVRLPRLGDRYRERAGYYSRMRHVTRRADAVWCPSSNTVEDVERHFGVRAERIPFCYDSERFPGAEQLPLSAPRFPLSLLSISRLVPHKNQALILRAVAGISPPPLVRILGEGPEAGNLRRLADTLGVRLDLPGLWASDQAIHSAYREASVLVCPSRFEGFGLTPLEGLAMGLPVVASDIPPHREFLGDAVRYFDPDDDASLARELEAVLVQPVPPARSEGSCRPGPPRAQRGADLPSILAPLTIDACASRLMPGLLRLLGRVP